MRAIWNRFWTVIYATVAMIGSGLLFFAGRDFGGWDGVALSLFALVCGAVNFCLLVRALAGGRSRG